MDKCSLELRNKLKKFYGEDVLDEKVGAFQAEVEGIFQKAKEEGTNPLKVLEERVNENMRLIEMDAYRRMKQVEAYNAATSQIKQFSDPKDGFRSLLFTRHGEEYKGRGSLEQFVASEKNRRISILKRELKDDMHIFKRLTDGDEVLELEVRKLELGEYTQAELGKVSQDAIKLHKAIKKLNDYDYKNKRLLGADVGYAKQRLHRQEHNARNMKELGMNNWVKMARESFKEEKIWDRINADEKLSKKYSKSEDPINAFLEDHYDKIILNESRKGLQIEDTFQSLQFMGQQKGFEAGRFFEFKNAEMQMRYNRELNQSSLFESIAKDIIRDSGSVGSMKLLGPNPNLTVKKAIQEFGLENADQLQKEFRFAAGRKAGVASGMLARAAGKARKITDMAMLHSSLVSTLPDFAISSYVLSSKTGKNYFSTLGSLLVENVKMLKAGQRAEYSRRFGILMDDELFEYHRIGEDGKLSNSLDPFKQSLEGLSPARQVVEGVGRKLGRGIDKAHNKVMRMTGLPAQSQIMRLATVKNYSMYLADIAGDSIDNLYPGTKNLFDRMGIKEFDWDILRTKVIKDAEDGSKILDADSILDLTKEDVGMSNKADFERYIYDLHSKVSGTYDFIASTGSPTPGVRSKAWVETIDPNTVAGVLARTVAQYKSFSISVYNSLREAYGPRFDKDRTLGLAYTMVTGMGLAYMGLGAREKLKGKEAPSIPWDDPREFAKMSSMLLARSGSAGLMFDFLSTDYNSPWRSLGGDIIGPSPRIIEQGIGIAKFPIDILMADDSKANKKAKRNLLNNLEKSMPSIPFTRTMINENIFDILHKSMNTGAKRK